MPHHFKRLAFISTHSSPLAQPGSAKAGGMNVYIAELARELGRTGYEVDIFTRADRSGLSPIINLSPGVRVINVKAGPETVLSPIDIHPWVTELSEQINDFVRRDRLKYDLIHSHYWLSGLSGIDLASVWRCPHVAMFHTLGEVKNRARRNEREPSLRTDSERRIIQRSNRIICATPHEREFLVSLYAADLDRVSVIPGGVDLKRFHPGDRVAARRDLGLPDVPLALLVGRLEPLKGIDIALRAVADAKLNPPLRLLIIGGDPTAGHEYKRLNALARDLRIKNRVIFLNPMPPAELAAYYRAANVCLIPSYYESFGLVAVEALASGIPVIAMRVGGLRDTVRDGRTGYLISWHCPEPFAERLETLLHNQDLADRFGRAGRESVLRFNWGAVACQVSEVYGELLDQSNVDAGSH